MARKAYITGWSHSPFGKLEDPDTEALMARVVRPALDHAQVAPGEVDGIFVGVMNNGFQKQDFQGALVALSEPGLASKPAVRVEDACATGSAAIYAALNFLEAGQGKVALVVGAEKMTAKPTAEIGDILLGASYRKEEAEVEGGFAGIFAPHRASLLPALRRPLRGTGPHRGQEPPQRRAQPLCANAQGFGLRVLQHDLGEEPLRRRTLCGAAIARWCRMGPRRLVLVAEDAAGDAPRAIRFRGTAHANDILPISGATRWPSTAPGAPGQAPWNRPARRSTI